jgi:hypothetical protein
MTSTPTTPEAEVPKQTPGLDSIGSNDGDNGADRSEKSVQENDAEAQHDCRDVLNEDDEAAQSPRADSGDKQAQVVSIDKPKDADVETSDEESTVSSGDANEKPDVDADASGAPPLPNEPLPATQDDGWDCHWDPAHQSWFFHNRITNESTWENPRVPTTSAGASASANIQLETPPATAVPPVNEPLPVGGYNPAIHGDYDPNAWYAQGNKESDESEVPVMDTATAYAAIGSFNRFTGRWQGEDQSAERHNDEAKSRRQMNAFFDVDAAANAHDGRSLKAERSGKKPTKSELKHFKEKRRARKEEKRRAWLRD